MMNQLGEGAFGTVYKAVLGRDRIVAVKMIRADIAALDEGAKVAFYEEIDTMIKICGPYIVEFVGFGVKPLTGRSDLEILSA